MISTFVTATASDSCKAVVATLVSSPELPKNPAHVLPTLSPCHLVCSRKKSAFIPLRTSALFPDGSTFVAELCAAEAAVELSEGSKEYVATLTSYDYTRE
jgi:hypothetical protein